MATAIWITQGAGTGLVCYFSYSVSYSLGLGCPNAGFPVIGDGATGNVSAEDPTPTSAAAGLGAQAELRMNLLGPLGAIRSDAPLTLSGVRERTLLCLLVFRGNLGIGLNMAVDELWAGSPPPSAQTSIRSYVTRLRRSIDLPGQPSIVSWHGNGYRMPPSSYESDIAVFDRLQAEASRETCAEARVALLASALELWRGRPCCDVTTTSIILREVERLEERRLVCLEDYVGARLELGLHRELVADLRAHVDLHPLREQFWQALVLALYRSGREGEALRIAHEYRAYLRDTLGAEPAREFAALEHAVLARDTALDWRPQLGPSVIPRGSRRHGSGPGADADELARGREMLSAGDPATAGTVFATALGTVGDPHDRDDWELSSDLLLGLAEARLTSRELQSGFSVALSSADFARAANSPSRLAAAAVWASNGLPVGHRDAEVEALCSEALEALEDEDHVPRALVLAGLANYQSFGLGEGDRAIETAATALSIAQSADNPRVLARCLFQSGETLDWTARVSERRLVAERLAKHGRDHGDVAAECDGLYLRALARIAVGDVEGFDEDRFRLEQLSPGYPVWYRHFFLWLWEGARSMMRGEFVDAESSLCRLFAVGSEEPNIQNLATGQLMMLRNDLGQLRAFLPLVEERARQDSVPVYTCALAWMLAKIGQKDAAGRLLGPLFDRGALRVPRDLTWTTSLCFLSETVAEVADRDAAAILLRHLAPYRGQVAVLAKGAAISGAIDRYIALLYDLLDDARARTTYEAALKLDESLGSPPLVARTKARFGEWLCRQRLGMDRRRGETLIAAGAATATKLEMQL
jgi:DNA-binding SARP family transcriptional activator